MRNDFKSLLNEWIVHAKELLIERKYDTQPTHFELIRGNTWRSHCALINWSIHFHYLYSNAYGAETIRLQSEKAAPGHFGMKWLSSILRRSERHKFRTWASSNTSNSVRSITAEPDSFQHSVSKRGCECVPHLFIVTFNCPLPVGKQSGPVWRTLEIHVTSPALYRARNLHINIA